MLRLTKYMYDSTHVRRHTLRKHEAIGDVKAVLPKGLAIAWMLVRLLQVA